MSLLFWDELLEHETDEHRAGNGYQNVQLKWQLVGHDGSACGDEYAQGTQTGGDQSTAEA